MKTKVKTTAIYYSKLERVFKTPILCDLSKIHTGLGIMPKVTHCTNDNKWGQVGSTKKVYVSKSLTQEGGFSSIDKVVERIENQYWKIEVSEFQSWMLGFSKFVGEWKTTELEKDLILVEYTYTMYSEIIFLYPLNWLFAKIFWKKYMTQVLENIRQLVYSLEPYMYK